MGHGEVRFCPDSKDLGLRAKHLASQQGPFEELADSPVFHTGVCGFKSRTGHEKWKEASSEAQYVRSVMVGVVKR